ncbi:PhoH family protein [Alkalibacter rhizosphaerae]|uniref:PhoH family protein n=1 Tax=Alkalibacter rhizosphaerae TaxID=2815577 RepID=UPI0035A8942E
MDILTEKTVNVGDSETMLKLFGKFDEHAKELEKSFHIQMTARDNRIKVVGEARQVDKAVLVLQQMAEAIDSKRPVDEQSLRYLIDLAEKGEEANLEELNDILCYTVRGKKIMPKTLGQKNYIKAMEKDQIVFGIGPAGTGKTYLAMAMAIKAFKREEVSRIVLTRPAVEAGESLGFLPGDLQDKVDPYLRPLYDALYDILGGEAFQRYKEKGMIEVAPLAYMRGRTLDDSFIILDEAQNTTPEQMKMFLTRLGFGSKAVVTGDITQIDLPGGKSSGLIKVMDILHDVDGISFVKLTQRDVVRHRLVQQIIQAYEEYENRKKTDTVGEKNRDKREGKQHKE